MSTPAIIFLAVVGISQLVAANLHGQERTGKHNFWVTVLGNFISLGLLYWGGFFS